MIAAARARQARVHAEPPRRVGAPSALQQRKRLAQAVEGVDRRLGVGHADVHVQGALGRAADQPSHLAPRRGGSGRWRPARRRRGRRRGAAPTPISVAPAAQAAARPRPIAGRRLGVAAARRASAARSRPEGLVARRARTAARPLASTAPATGASPWVSRSTSSSSSSSPTVKGSPRAEGVLSSGPRSAASRRDASEHERGREPAGVAAVGDPTGVRAAGEHAGRRLRRARPSRRPPERRRDAGDALDRHAAGLALARARRRLGRRDHLPHAALAHALSSASSSTETRRARAAGAPSTARRRSPTRSCASALAGWRWSPARGARRAGQRRRTPSGTRAGGAGIARA